jgi:flagellar hook protein FlgE
MTLNTALRAGVSGLYAQGSRLSAISDNISNSSTVGYKRADVAFETLVTGGGSRYTAGGVTPETVRQISKQGTILSSSSTTHMAIDGRGMFATADSSDVNALATKFQFTRSGQFGPDGDGFLRNTAGNYLLGWPFDNTGTIGAVNRESFDDLQPINVRNITSLATPTTEITFAGNLPSQLTGLAVPPSALQTSIRYFDPLGNQGEFILSWQATVTPNRWTFNVSDNAGEDYGDVTVDFNNAGPNAGTVDTYSGVTNNATAPAAFAFDVLTGIATITVDNGTPPQVIDLDIGAPDVFGGMTQFNGDYRPSIIQSDGSGSADLSRVEVTSNGTLSAVFTDGSRRAIFQIPLADVSNPDGMLTDSGNIYLASRDSGNFRLWDANAAGLGKVSGGSLEQSNVDLAEELTLLIETQRAYSTSAKIVQTADEMMELTTQLKR